MKKKSDLRLYFLPLLLMIVALLPACKKNAENNIMPLRLLQAIKNYIIRRLRIRFCIALILTWSNRTICGYNRAEFAKCNFKLVLTVFQPLLILLYLRRKQRCCANP
jgi:hypothetical protein